MSDVIIGVDVGGTFTDLIYMRADGSDVRIAKVPTTTGNQAEGFNAQHGTKQSPRWTHPLKLRRFEV